MKNVTLILVSLFLTQLSISQTARVQVIHNSADMAATMVDIYLDTTKLIDDFEFRTASSFIDAPAGTPISIGIAPSNSSSQADTIVSFVVTLTANETYVVVADGIVSTSGYSPSPAFNLEIYGMGREMASTTGNTDVLVHHGSTDAPTVDVEEVGAGAGTIVDDLSYAAFDGYLELPTADYVLEIRDESGTTTVESYDAPLSTLGLEDSALVVVASGFLDPSMNSMGPAFGLYVALPSGGNLIALPVTAPTGINQEIEEVNWSVFPNPASDLITLNLENNTNHMVQIFNAQGQLVYEDRINDYINTIDISQLNTGLYHIRLQDFESRTGIKTIAVSR